MQNQAKDNPHKNLVPSIAWLPIFLRTMDYKSSLPNFNTLGVVSCIVLTIQELVLIVYQFSLLFIR